MAWKEIYYINLFANENTTNDSELYSDGVTDLHLDDNWITYTKNINAYNFSFDRISKNQDLITNIQLISLLHKIVHTEVQSIQLVHILTLLVLQDTLMQLFKVSKDK